MTRFTAAQRGAKKAKATVKTQKAIRVKHESKVEEAIQEQFMGLCMTCIHAQGCAFRRDVAQAVLECDEFDIGQTAPAKFDITLGAPAAIKDDELSKFKGLCVNCDVRQDCKLSKPEEGVWHCEEYV